MPLSRRTRNIVLPASIACGCGMFYASWKLLSTSVLKTSELSSSFQNLNDAAGPHWFMWHPLFAIIGTMIIPVPAVILRKYKGYWSKKIHAYCFILSLMSTMFSLYIIFCAKEAKAKPHISTLHAKLGLAVSLGYLSLGFAGALGLDPDFALQRIKQNGNLKDAIKSIHKLGGRAVLVGGYITCFTGWYKFFDRGVYMWAGVGAVAIASLLTYIDPIVSTIERMVAPKHKSVE